MLINMVVWSRLAVKYHKSVTFVPYGHVLFHKSYSLSILPLPLSPFLLPSLSPLSLPLPLPPSPSLPPSLSPFLPPLSLSFFTLFLSLFSYSLSLSHTHHTLSCFPISLLQQETTFYGCTVRINEPVGAIGIACPDDYPLLAFVSLFAPAVIRGNTIVIIPSEKHPLSATDLYQV